MRFMGSHGEGSVWSANSAMDSSNCGFLSLSLPLYFSTCVDHFRGPNFNLRHSVSTLFTMWASCTTTSSQKTSYFLALGTCKLPTWAPHLYMTPPTSFAARAMPRMQCSHWVTPLPSSLVVPFVRTVCGSHQVRAACTMALKSTGGRSAASVHDDGRLLQSHRLT